MSTPTRTRLLPPVELAAKMKAWREEDLAYNRAQKQQAKEREERAEQMRKERANKIKK